MSSASSSSRKESSFKLPDNIKLLLIDFDKTLTLFHTAGAQFFSKENPLFVFNAELEQDIYFADNNAARDAAQLWAAIKHWTVDCKICVAIITMADSMHAESLQLTPYATAIRNTHDAVGGSEMVWRWLHSIAYAGLMDRIQRLGRGSVTEEEIDSAIEKENLVLQNDRLLVVASFHQSSKRSHVSRAISLFQSRNVLASVEEEEIVYIDDTESLLQDVKSIMPNVCCIHAANGINETAWRNWFPTK